MTPWRGNENQIACLAFIQLKLQRWWFNKIHGTPEEGNPGDLLMMSVRDGGCGDRRMAMGGIPVVGVPVGDVEVRRSN